MKRIVTVGIVVAVFAALASAASASHSWGGYHWARTVNPATIKVIDANTSDWDAALDRAISDWSVSTVIKPVKEAGAEDRRCRPVAGKVKSCNAAYGKNGWLGLAQIWANGSHIAQGTSKMNDSYFSLVQYNDPTKRQQVMCQEIGHTWGLAHQDESGADLNTCMDYSRLLDNPSPNQHDYDELALIYSHLDLTTTIATGLAGSAAASPVATERIDRISTSTITEIYADGSRRITHITWALEDRGNSKNRPVNTD